MFKLPRTKDSKWYFKLHNVHVVDNMFMFTLDKFELKDNLLTVRRKCNNLTSKNLCKGHPDNKPHACKYFTLETANEDKHKLRSECLFAHILKIEKGLQCE